VVEVVGARSSGGAAWEGTELGSTTASGWVVEPGASVAGSLPTPASVVTDACDAVEPI
jgi:hypothetical protein